MSNLDRCLHTSIDLADVELVHSRGRANPRMIAQTQIQSPLGFFVCNQLLLISYIGVLFPSLRLITAPTLVDPRKYKTASGNLSSANRSLIVVLPGPAFPLCAP